MRPSYLQTGIAILFLISLGLGSGGCNAKIADPSAELEKLRPINEAHNAASARLVERNDEFKDAPKDERVTRGLQAYFETLKPALTEFLDSPPSLNTQLESDLREYNRLVSRLDKLYTELVNSERFDLAADKRTQINELLKANDEVESRIATYVYDLMDQP